MKKGTHIQLDYGCQIKHHIFDKAGQVGTTKGITASAKSVIAISQYIGFKYIAHPSVEELNIPIGVRPC